MTYCLMGPGKNGLHTFASLLPPDVLHSFWHLCAPMADWIVWASLDDSDGHWCPVSVSSAVWVKVDGVQKSEMIILLKFKIVPTLLSNHETMIYCKVNKF